MQRIDPCKDPCKQDRETGGYHDCRYFQSEVVDVSKDNLMIELTGNVNKIEAFINLISDFGVIEIVRTGITGLSRGEDNSNIF